MLWGVGLWMGLLWFATPAAPAIESPTFQEVMLQGTVIEPSDALRMLGLPTDPDEPITGQVVLKGSDGALTPILCDESSRGLVQGPPASRSPGRTQGATPRRPALLSGNVASGRTGRQTPDARILFRRLHDSSWRSPDLSMLPGEMVLRMRPDVP